MNTISPHAAAKPNATPITRSDAQTKMTEVLNALGEASARAQGLTKPVTSAQKLRNTEHSVYLLAEEAGKK